MTVSITMFLILIFSAMDSSFSSKRHHLKYKNLQQLPHYVKKININPLESSSPEYKYYPAKADLADYSGNNIRDHIGYKYCPNGLNDCLTDDMDKEIKKVLKAVLKENKIKSALGKSRLIILHKADEAEEPKPKPVKPKEEDDSTITTDSKEDLARLLKLLKRLNKKEKELKNVEQDDDVLDESANDSSESLSIPFEGSKISDYHNYVNTVTTTERNIKKETEKYPRYYLFGGQQVRPM